jgi:glycosyltransferase involved in cell wall biosynthesis
MSAEKIVIFWQRVTCDYRKEFFLLLNKTLSESGIKLTLISGQPWPNEGLVDIASELSFSLRSYNQKIFRKLYWPKGAYQVTKRADLVISEQANSVLLNYVLLLKRKFTKKPKIALFGHGLDWQQSSKNKLKLKDGFKLFWTKQCDWFFAYTKKSADILQYYGFPKEKLTVVNNAIDTTAIRKKKQALKAKAINQLKCKLFGLVKESDVFGVFCGRFTQEKLVPFLLRSIALIKQELPNFKMLIIGDGAERETVKNFCQKNSWCVWVGAKYGLDKVEYLAVGDIWLHPGMVGLAILDAFALGMPLATTDIEIHSPEINYLKPNINGLLTGFSEQEFAQEVIAVLKNKQKLKQMQQAALADSHLYTVEEMVKQFSAGIKSCLALKE